MRLDGRSGHEAGRELLTSLCGGTLPEIRYTDRGKPYFEDNSLHFSISHTKNHAFCAISSQNIGIDAEETDRKVSLRLADAYLSPIYPSSMSLSERRYLKNTSTALSRLR